MALLKFRKKTLSEWTSETLDDNTMYLVSMGGGKRFISIGDVLYSKEISSDTHVSSVGIPTESLTYKVYEALPLKSVEIILLKHEGVSPNKQWNVKDRDTLKILTSGTIDSKSMDGNIFEVHTRGGIAVEVKLKSGETSGYRVHVIWR